MDRAAENFCRMKRSTISQEDHPVEGMEVGSEKRNNNRRALQDIKNFVGRPCMITRSKVTQGGKRPHGVVSHQPMTSYAASLGSKSHACSQEPNTKLSPICHETHKAPTGAIISDNSAAIQVDDSKSANNLPLLMVDEIEELAESELHDFEMEDLEEEDPIIDIDACDSKNPLAVIDYVEDIYSFYRNTEVLSCVSPDYMSNQFDINEKMRGILIDWLIEVHYKFELMEETLYLTVNIIDRFLAHHAMARKKLQLVGVTAMLLASKYEEISAPGVEDLILITDRTYTRTEIIVMEKFMVNSLKFNLSVPTPYVFMKRFLKAAEADEEVELVSFFFIELCLVEYKMLKFRPSMLAAAAIYTAQCTVRRFKHWTRTCELYSCYSEEQLQECSRMMVDLHENAGVGKLTGVYRKYSTNKFGRVARLEPALYMLEDTN